MSRRSRSSHDLVAGGTAGQLGVGVVTSKRGGKQMRPIGSDVFVLEGLRATGVYAVGLDDGVALIDTGFPGTAGSIVAQLTGAGYRLGDLKGIVLTHAHVDHIGNAAELARRSGAQVLAHRDEIPFIQSAESLPSTSTVARATAWAQRFMPGVRTHCRVDRPLEDGETIADLGGLLVIHTPGHTPGSICLYHAAGRILFCGDLLLNGHPLTGRGTLRFAMRVFSVDVAQARESVRRLRELPIDVLCPGHGTPIQAGAGDRIEALLQAESA